jgi:four helix bundle protein
MTHKIDSGFAHQRLDAFHLSMELALGVERLVAGLPRGYADLKDQVRRAAGATMRNLTEGANRWAAKDKAARFAIARGECGECDAALQMIAALGLAQADEVAALRQIADRVGAMLTALIRQEKQRAGEPSGSSRSGCVRPASRRP